MRTALTIAGSDSGGGAGVQADLKTFAAHGVYGTSVITAVTAQNTLGVRAWQAMPVELVIAQLEAVVTDIGADAVKIGMLGNAEIVRAVSGAIEQLDLKRVVVDPVMIAKGGARLIEPNAIEDISQRLLPLADVVTPNIPEAEVLSGMRIQSREEMIAAGRRILQDGPRVVLIKGGHLDGPESFDIACSAAGCFEISGPRIATRNTHGTGCTLSSAIAANLATGVDYEQAVRQARAYLDGAIRTGPAIGGGHRPLNHMWRWLSSDASQASL